MRVRCRVIAHSHARRLHRKAAPRSNGAGKSSMTTSVWRKGEDSSAHGLAWLSLLALYKMHRRQKPGQSTGKKIAHSKVGYFFHLEARTGIEPV